LRLCKKTKQKFDTSRNFPENEPVTSSDLLSMFGVGYLGALTLWVVGFFFAVVRKAANMTDSSIGE
jgi:hypothetical protein